MSGMTRKDYVVLAGVIQDTYAQFNTPGQPDYNSVAGWGVATVALNICDVLAADNPRFDRERFLTACGVSS